MHCSRWAVSLATLLFGICPNLAEAQNLQLVNGSTNSVLYVATALGRCSVQAGRLGSWQAAGGEVVTNGFDSTESGTFTALDGHDYLVLLGEGGVVSFVDRTPSTTRWFWLGLTFSGCFGLACLGARWTKSAVFGNSGSTDYGD